MDSLSRFPHLDQLSAILHQNNHQKLPGTLRISLKSSFSAYVISWWLYLLSFTWVISPCLNPHPSSKFTLGGGGGRAWPSWDVVIGVPGICQTSLHYAFANAHIPSLLCVFLHLRVGGYPGYLSKTHVNSHHKTKLPRLSTGKDRNSLFRAPHCSGTWFSSLPDLIQE